MSISKQFFLRLVVLLVLIAVATVAYLGRHQDLWKRPVPAAAINPVARQEPAIRLRSEATHAMLPDPPPAAAVFPSVANVPASLKRSGQPEVRGEDPLRVMVYDVLEAAIHKYLPEYEFSASDMALLTDALLRVRAAHQAVNQLAVTAENSEILRRLREQLLDALDDFESISGFSVDEFTRQVQPHVGIDVGTDEDTDVAFERLSDYPPGQ